MIYLTDMINFSIGAVGMVLSLFGLFVCATSHVIDAKIRHHILRLFTIMAAYSAVVSLSYLPVPAVWIRHSIVLSSALAAALMPILTRLIFLYTGEKPLKNSLYLCIMLLLAIYSAMLLSTYFVPVFFTIDNAGIYRRGPLYPLLLIPPVLIMILNLCCLLLRKHMLSQRIYRAFLVYIMVPMLSMVIQMFYQGILATALGAIIGSVIMFIFIYNDQQDAFIRLTEENADREFSIRILQMRPHFIYNALTSIYYIIEEDPDKARRVTRDFAVYLRSVFGSVTSQVPVPFSEELEHTRAYLSVESARFPEQLSISYDITHTDFSIPPLTLQPVVENAIKHGMDPEIDKLSVIIKARRCSGYSEITVENDGENFQLPADFEDRDGVGLGSTRERLKRMCNGDLLIEQREGGGTVVTIRIPD